MKRRQFIQALGAGIAAASTMGCATVGRSASAKVVVIGGGYGGATTAKYLRMWGGDSVEVTLVEPSTKFISCPLSNLVIGGSMQMADITFGYEQLERRHGVRVIHDAAQSIDVEKRLVQLSGGQTLSYDRLVLSPGIDFMWEQLPGMGKAGAQDKVLHAWKAGPQTLALRRQLEEMPDGGTYVISIPQAPYRCPPGPYERASQVAHYFSQAKKKSKVIILDANDDVTSKGPLFKKFWADRYKGILEYHPKFMPADVDAASGSIMSEFGDTVKAAVLNVVPSQRAGAIAVKTGLANVNKRWCEVDYMTFESTQAKNVHIIGDAMQLAPTMPKSGHMANQQAKVCAAAVLDLLAGRAPNPKPIVSNTCYSFVSDKEVIHVASVHTYDMEKKTLLPVPGSGGVSTAANELEALYGRNWANNIWADVLA